MKFNIFILDIYSFVCCRDKLGKLIKVLHQIIRENTCRRNKPFLLFKSEDSQNYSTCTNSSSCFYVYPFYGVHFDLPDFPRHHTNTSMGTSSPVSANTDQVLGRSLQENIPSMVQLPDQIFDENDVRRDQSPSFADEQHSSSEIFVTESSFHNATASFIDYRVPPPGGVKESRTFRQGLVASSASVQHQQYQKQLREITFTKPTILQAVPQQRNRNDYLVRVLGPVRSPEHADLDVRLDSFSRWPSDTAQEPARVAEAGFYYTGLQDIVRCFACNGGLKNWGPDDRPWVKHARSFPECAYVRHLKGEEFINRVQLMTDELDEEFLQENYIVYRGATWEGAENSNTNTYSALTEIKEPTVLECEDAQIIIGMGFSKKDVAMAINDIFKKGKHDFNRQEIADIILEKETHREQTDSVLVADSPPSARNTPATEQAMSENKHLKELLECTECKTKQRNILFLPCTHHVVCESCSLDLHICTCCFRKIQEKVKTYRC